MLDPTNDADWSKWAALWSLRPDTIYLNHGSFGPPPEPVIAARREWQRRLDEQPMDFFVRQDAAAWFEARKRLAAFVGTHEDNLVFVENATAAMNVVAYSFALNAGDEVLLTDHEYGAVVRIWKRACEQTGATLRTVDLPRPFTDSAEVVATIANAVTPRTRIAVVSHITSPTAVILPIRDICLALKSAGVAVCVDGPHAPAQAPLAIDALGCDFYCASLHKWLSAPFGSGFLYVAPDHQWAIQPPNLSWGRLQPTQPMLWFDEFIWSGTRDSSPYLAVPAAINLVHAVGEEAFRVRTHHLAQYARRRLVELLGTSPLVPDDSAWYGSMAHVPLPVGKYPENLQVLLWEEHGIEVPVMKWGGDRFIRVSCHLYTTHGHIDRLLDALEQVVSRGGARF